MSSPGWTIPIDSSSSLPAIMSTQRSQFGAATGPDGQLYLAGGIDGGAALKTVDVWDPVGRTMKALKSQMKVARYAFALVTAWDGGIWAIGGFTDSGATDSVERYDVVSGIWTTDTNGKWKLTNDSQAPGDPSYVPRGAVAAAVGPDHRIYMLGGIQYQPPPANWTGPWPFSLSSPTDVLSLDPFNPSAGWRKEKKPMNKGRQGHTAATGIDGNVYVFGGDRSNSVEMFNGIGWTLFDDSGALYPPVPLPVVGFATAAAPDGSIYCVGGHYPVPNELAPPHGSSVFAGYTAVNPAWDPTNPTYWTPAGYTSIPRPGAAAAVAEGELFVAGQDSSMEAYGLLPAVRAASPAALSASAVGWWRFDESSVGGSPGPYDTNTMVMDSVAPFVGSPIKGGLSHIATGKVHGALGFHETGYADVANVPKLNFDSGDLSVEFWVKNVPSPVVGVAPVLDKRTQIGHQFTGYLVFLDSGGVVGLQLANGSKYANYLSTLPISLVLNVWTHVAISVDRTSGSPQITFYINGVNANGVYNGSGNVAWTGIADANIFVPLPGSVTNGADLFIGKHHFNSSYFHGFLDELTLYNTALSWIEVRSIFLAGSAGKV